ncbi:MAG TPA: SET domain-containing protein-lysine N-methyltransferase [Puia sp.]
MFFSRTVCQPDSIEVRDSPLHGRGVFATKNISRGALIEVAPAVFLSAKEKELLRHSLLFNYYFLVDDADYPAVFGFGYSSFYNHSEQANAFYASGRRRGVIRFYAYRKILAGEEITKDEHTLSLVMGFGSMYNYSRYPNAEFMLYREDKVMVYTAFGDIPAHTEITINYGGEYGHDYSKWFADRGFVVVANALGLQDKNK